jgi:polysaccharide biosynthesis protein PslG
MKQMILTGIFLICLSANFAQGFTSADVAGTGKTVSPGTAGIFGTLNSVCAGVNIHFTKGHEKDLDMISAAGFKYIRTDLVWQDIEYSKGSYDWTAYDELTANLDRRGLRAIYILDYSNSLYEDTVTSKDPITGEEIRDIAAPSNTESIAAYSRWATQAAMRFRNSNIIWEIWNEPNVSFWRPVPDVDQYIRLSKAVCEAVKSAVPGSVIIGPATSQIPFSFLETFMASGVLKYLDGLSVHPYRDYSLPPESADSDYQKLRELIEQFAPEGKKNLPVISSEWGYASCPKGVTPEKQAALAVRMQLANLLSGVPVSVWYDWKNDGESPTNFEHNCGTVTFDLCPKPAYNALKTMNEQLKGLTLTHRISLNNTSDYALLFISPEGIFKLCAWTNEKAHSIRLEMIQTHSKALKAVDGYGKSMNLQSDSDGLKIDLNELPQYITLPCGVRLN